MLASMVTAFEFTDLTDIGQDLPGDYEPSGAVYDGGFLYIVSDEGDISVLDDYGNEINSFHIGGDLEGITVGREEGYVYVVIENPATLAKVSLEDEVIVQTWDLREILGDNGNAGPEALTWIPRINVFAVGLQADGNMYLIKVRGDNVILIDVVDMPRSSDLSGLDYEPRSRTLFAIYDSYDEAYVMKYRGRVWRTLETIEMPEWDAEGIAISDSRDSFFIADDDNDLFKVDFTF